MYKLYESFCTNRPLMAGIVLVLAIISFNPVFAESTGFEEPINGVFDWINEMFTDRIDESNLDKTTQDNLQDTLDAGTDAGKKGTTLWFAVHEFFVNAIFAGVSESDLPIDKDIIVIISIILVAGLMIGLILKLIRENTKIALVVIAILVVLGIIGVTVEF